MADRQKKNPYEDIHAEIPQPSSYKVIEPVQELPEPEPILFSVAPPVVEVKAPAAQAPVLLPLLNELWKERLRRFAQNPVRVYTAAGIGLGIFFGIIAIAIFWHIESEDGRYDLDVAHSSAAGLKGHLFVEWDRKVKYRLTIEPEDAKRQTGFALAVSNSPRPLSVSVQLQDSQGFVLCSGDVLLKYDARNAEALTATTSRASALKANPAAAPTDQSAQWTDFAKLEGQELEREMDKDLFQNQIGPDGTISAIAAQGEIPCSKSAYLKAMTWSFTTNFPSLAEQDALLKRQQEVLAPPPPPSARKKKPMLPPLPYTIEGDDAIVEFDPSSGVIETRGRKLFTIDELAAAAANPAWQDYPVSFHFHCDQMSNCTLMHSGLGALHVRMKR
jgi:hypothetical protein